RQLRPDIADMTIDRAVRDVDIHTIGGDHDLVAAKYDVSDRKEGLENRKLASGQVERMTIEFGGMLHRSKRQGAMRQWRLVHWRGGRSGSASQDDVDPRNHLARAERLGHIVVAAELEADDPVDLVIARR